MANYTYEQFQKAAQEAGMWDKFSDADRKLAQSNPDAGMSLLGYKKDYAAASSEQGRLLANAGANGIRKQYGGYTGGSDGSGYALTGEGNGSFNSAANEQANAMLALLERRGPYSYDAKTDPNAQAYRKQYAREGQRATKDTMGSYAAMTGGTPSTAAVTAAQQAGNYYAAQSADKVAELEQLAYSRYQDEGDQMRQKWSMYRDQADAEYSRWLNEKSLQAQAEQLEYERAQAEYQRKYNEAVLAAQYGDYRGLRELGIDTSNYMTGGYPYYSDGGSDDSGGDGQPEINLDEAYNELLGTYWDGIIPAADWNQLAAVYGEEQLAAWGFRQAADEPVRPTAEQRREEAAAVERNARNTAPAARNGATVQPNSEASDFESDLQTALRLTVDGVTPAKYYDIMVRRYGEERVKAAGLVRGE